MTYPSSSQQQLSLNSQCGGYCKGNGSKGKGKRKRNKCKCKGSKRNKCKCKGKGKCKRRHTTKLHGGGLVHPSHAFKNLLHAFNGEQGSPDPHAWRGQFNQTQPDATYSSGNTPPLSTGAEATGGGAEATGAEAAATGAEAAADAAATGAEAAANAAAGGS